MYRHVAMWSLAVFAAGAIACSDSVTTPVSPTSSTGVVTDATGPDGSTLKVTAPTPQAPANGAILAGSAQLILAVQGATGKFVPIAVQHRFEIRNPGGTVVFDQVVAGTSVVPSALDPNTTYRWRARGENAQGFGPWSAEWTFRTPEKPVGYLRGNEVFDPLTDGRTIGVISGPVTFIPGVGARLENFNSRISYKLETPLSAGELSVIVTGMHYDTNGDKTKVFSMYNSNSDAPGSDLTTSKWRMTVEKRGDDVGGDANFRLSWKFIAGNLDDFVEAGPERRAFIPFAADKAYLWRATWGDIFRVEIREGGASGPVLYDEGEHYNGVYRPDPHWVHIGAPIPRAGETHATIPGMIVRNVWVSSQPRPGFAE
jgi:hypothetical protein